MSCPSWRRRAPVLFLAPLAVAAALALGSCGEDREASDEVLAPFLPAVPFDYLSVPQLGHVGLTDHTPTDNPVTNAGATLGRVLFYDKLLSVNDTTACGSCHRQELAFSDGRARAVGVQGRELGRSAIALVNLRFQPDGGDRSDDDHSPVYGLFEPDGFFWDMRAPTLEAQALMPIQDPLELGMDLTALPGKLQALPYYPPLFEAAFGDRQVTADRVARALAQFVRSIVSTHSRFDEGAAQGLPIIEPWSTFTAQENEGKRLFFETVRCAFCHQSLAATAGGAYNNGLDLVSTDPGLGVERNAPNPDTGGNIFVGFFKAPSLRNIELTAPYMHDGRLATLEDVVEHYASGIQAHPNLSLFLKEAGVRPALRRLTAQNKAALVAFLKTMTDRSVLSDPKLSDPFQR